jgi:predicted phosphodiesterase
MWRDIPAFDAEKADALRRIWFLGDVHAEFKHVARALLNAVEKPRWLVFLGDIDIDHKPFREILEPLTRNFPDVNVAFIHGNHDGDTHEHWAMLHDCGPALRLHGQVLDLDSVLVAGLGGNFLGRVWMPPGEIKLASKLAAMNRGAYQFRPGQRPSSSFHAAIYPDDVAKLAEQRADILVTHEAPSCHHHGFAALDELARSMHVVRTFHGHHHDDRSEEYAEVREELGFDAMAVGFRAIKNGLGEIIFAGPKE